MAPNYSYHYYYCSTAATYLQILFNWPIFSVITPSLTSSLKGLHLGIAGAEKNKDFRIV